MFSPLRNVAGVAALVVLAGLAACAPKVTREEFQSEVAKIRTEMQDGDQALATRIDSVDTRITALENELAAFRSEYNVSVERMQSAIKFNVPVHFDFAQATLRESDRPVLDRFAGVVKEYYPNAVITVEGFADPAGSLAYNRRLGLERAGTVRDYLATDGALTSANLRVVSYGETRNRQVVPGAAGPGAEGLENRRVALVIDYATPDATPSQREGEISLQ